ncbi:host specificity factor TipJ family phage tail protein [Pandoraea communis]|uniref:host specificity factor TipJ family phage tail protein n=1 Tax=Pandoraea communis TaxID=2508297 RepID=UPI0025A5DD2F|nr:host specificity factor TipJ family phage tail protein [Pandoraea communis]MDM8356679.1 host specificity factor TipJ family phage tail protein [Pandoraea communis]
MEVIDQQAPAFVHMPHPLTADGRATYYAGFLADETLGDYLQRHGVMLPRGAVSLWCNGIPVPSANWEQLIPYPGDKIVIRTALEGGGGGVGKVLRTVAMVAVAIAAPALGAMAVSSFGGIGLAATIGANGILIANGIAAAAIMIGGSMLVNALLPPPKASLSASTGYQTNSQTPTYALNGGQNSSRLYEPMLLCIGYNKVVPDLASTPYTEFSGQDQYLYQAFNFGLSDITLTDFMIGDTPIANYADVTIQVSGSDGKLPMIAGNVDSLTVQDLSSSAGWVQRTTSVDTVSIAIDIVTTLYYVNDKGGNDPRAVSFHMQYCPTGTGAWIDFAGGTVSITGSSPTPLRNTYKIDVAQGQYDVRVIKLTGDVTSTRESNALTWSQMRSYQIDTTDYTGQTRVGVRIRASSQLNGTISTFSAKAQAVCPVWNGSAWVTQATSNPAWWCLWWARGKFINGRRVYGAGLPDSRIDIEGIKAFGAYCDANGLTCNFVQGAATSIGTMMDQIALNGDGSATWLTGKLGVVWDAPNQPPIMQFGPFNIKRDSFQVEYNTQNLADEIVVNFINPAKGWTTDQVRAKSPNVTAPSNPVTLDFTGCTSATLAGRKANLMAAAQYYHRRKMTWVSDLEGFVAQRGDVVVLSHDMTAWSFAGRMTGGDRNTLRLDRSVPLSGTPGYVGIRFPDGTYQVFGVQGGAGSVDSLTLTAAIPSALPVPDENPDMLPYDWAFFYDPLATPGKLVKITAVIPQAGGDEVQIIATDEEPLYYAAASGVYDYMPPRQYSHLSGDVLSIAFNEMLLDGVTGRSRVTVSWATGAPTDADVSVCINGGASTKYSANGNSLDIDAYTNDSLSVTVQPTALVKLTSTSSMSGRYVVQGILSPLPTPANASIVYRDQLTHIIWSPVVDVRALSYEVRLGSTWQSAIIVADTVVSGIVAQGDGTYFIASRYQAPSGTVVYSAPASIVVAGASLVRNVLVTREESPVWSGTLGGGAAVNAGSLLLAGVGNILADANVLPEVNVLEYGGIATAGSYTLSPSRQVNVGRVVPCQLIVKSSVHGVRSTDNILTETSVFDNQDVLGEALGTVVTAKPQIAVAQADGVFGAWQDFQPGIYSGQYFTARMLLTSSDVTIKPIVDQFSFTVDMPDRLDTGTSVQVVSAGIDVTFNSAFNAGPNAETEPHVQITLLNAQAGDVVVLSSITLAGFHVQVLNGTTPVARYINWSAQGY